MRNPLKLDPGTKMLDLSFDDEGKSPILDVEGGDGDRQIEALWQYMRELGTPPGKLDALALSDRR